MKLLIIDRKTRKYIKNQNVEKICKQLENNNVEIKWVLLDPEVDDSKKFEKNLINYVDFEEYNTNNIIEILKIEKPNVILIFNDYDFIVRGFIPAAKYLNIKSILFFSSIIDDETEKMNKLLIKNRATDIFERRKLLLKNYQFMLKNYRNCNYSINNILKIIYKDFILSFRYFMPWGQFGSDIILVSGNAWEKKLQKLRVKSTIIKTGHPAMDKIFEDVKKFKKFDKTSNELTILLMTTPMVEHNLWTEKIWEKIISDILMKCSNLSNTKIIIKIHPTGERIEKYQKILKDLKLNLEIYQKEDLGQLVASSDIIITYGVSSGTHYGVFLKKPVLVYNPINMTLDEIPFVREKLATEVKNIDELPYYIKNASSAEKKNIENFISKYMYKFDGLSSKRISDLILKEIINNKFD